jgi:4-aminobutyrate aminotransferase-like enzyme
VGTVPKSEWLERARRHCFRGRLDGIDVGGPVFVRGSGSLVWDVDGKAYLDFNAGQMCSATAATTRGWQCPSAEHI